MANRSAFTNSIGQMYYEANTEPYVFGQISLVFSPKQGREIVDDLTFSLSRHPYHFTFSEFSNDEFIEIEPGDEVNTNTFGDLEPYGGHLLITKEFEEDLEVGGSNHTLSTQMFFRAPARATHVTLWFQEDEASPREFVRRVELKTLEGWNRYFQPLIDDNS